MNRLVLILGLIGALVAPDAIAANWLKNCQTTSSAAAMSLTPGSFACQIPVSASDNSSGLLDVSACGDIDILFFEEADGDATASGGTGNMRSCPAPGFGTADGGTGLLACWKINATDLTGLSQAAGATYKTAGNWIFWEQVAYTTVTEPIKLIVRCNGPRQ